MFLSDKMTGQELQYKLGEKSTNFTLLAKKYTEWNSNNIDHLEDCQLLCLWGIVKIHILTC